MSKILVMSIHPPYDYRIDRHLRSLVSLNHNVTYINFINKKNKFNNYEGSQKVKYIGLNISKKNHILNFFSVIRFFKNIIKEKYDYYFIQDPMLLFFLLIVKNKEKKIIIDIHESKILRNKYDDIALKFFLNPKKKYNLFTPYDSVKYEFSYNNVLLMRNYPMKSDFTKIVDKTITPCICYVGMITDQHRQCSKMLDIFKVLLKCGYEVHLVGKVSNDSSKDRILHRICELEKEPLFTYHGFLSRNEVVHVLSKCHFLISLLSLDEKKSISPNKIYESILSGNIVISDHYNFEGFNIEEFETIKVSKVDDVENISDLIISYINKNLNDLNRICNDQRDKYLEKNVVWEKYIDFYNIFK